MSPGACRILYAVLLAALGLLAGSVSATIIDPEFTIRVAERPSEIIPGKSVELEFIISTVVDSDIRNTTLSGKGWQVTARPAMKSMGMGASVETALPFTVTPDGTWEPMTLEFTLNGVHHQKSVDLSPLEVRMTRFVGDLKPAGKISFLDRRPGRIEDPPGTKPGPVPLDQLPPELAGVPRPDTDTDNQSAKSITVRGVVGFYHSDSFRPVFGLTVLAYMWGGLYDHPLGHAVTNRDGSFEIPIGNMNNGVPVGIKIVASNEAMRVMVDSWIWEDVYYWRSPVKFTDGSDLDWGTQVAEDYQGAMNIVSAASRANTFLHSNSSISGLPWVDIWWPCDCDKSEYVRESIINPTPDIYITSDQSSNNGVHIHEYGHHFLVTQASSAVPDYCNPGAFCDDDPGGWFPDCSHCPNCPENTSVAYTEGVPNWISDKVCRLWLDEPGREPIGPRKFARIQNCIDGGVDHGYSDPWISASGFAALLRDMDSDEFDDDPAYDVNNDYYDNLTVPVSSILTTIISEEPNSPQHFIFDFMSLYPQYNELFWLALGNNGFTALDTAPPIAGTIWSPSHPVNVARPAARVQLASSGYSDSFSGLAGFNIQINRDEPLEPGTEVNLPAPLTLIELDAQPPGEYFITVRAIDNAGITPLLYETYGPVIIRDPIACDLFPEPWTEYWAYPVVPKDAPVLDGQVVPADTNELAGNTYWNACLVNVGEVDSPNQRSAILLDGVEIDHLDGVVEGYAEHLEAWNQGPLPIAGGRHTFELAVDHYQTVAETDEMNNDWAKQWIWSPTIMVHGSTYYSDAAPLRTAGWDATPGGGDWYNCNGYRIFPSIGAAPSTWVAVWARAANKSRDVDVRMHAFGTTATSGFDANIGASYRPPGYLDAVLVNTDVNSAYIYDIGIMTAPSQTEPSSYRAAASFGHSLDEGVAFTTTLAAMEGMDLYTFLADPDMQYTVTLELDEMDMSGPIRLTRYHHGFGTGNLLDFEAMAVTDTTKLVNIDFTTTHTGQATHAFAVWRDEMETFHYAQSYTIMVRESPPDLVPATPAQWAWPIVPRTSDDATDVWAPEPTVLVGDTDGTYLNYAVGNQSETDAPSTAARVDLDGTQYYLNLHAPMAGGAVSTFRSGSPVEVRGGRHMLSLTADQTDFVNEANETNNTYATQYVWRPSTLAFGNLMSRPEPPQRTVDWGLPGVTGEIWYSCDAKRTPTWKPSGTSSYWGAIAAIPGASSDVDLRLHYWSSGARNGFDAPLALSAWSRGQAELLILNFRNTGIRAYDVGVTQGGYTSGEDYKITVAKSVYLGADPDGELGTWTMGTDDLVHIYETYITVAGLYHATLSVANPALDLGFSLYGSDLVLGGTSDVKNGTAAGWLETGGTDDTFDFLVQPVETGPHGLAVWKVGASDVPLTSDYTLTIELDELSPVFPNDTPLATRLLGAYPNPFNPMTTIAFELDRPATAGLKIYDISGRMVCHVMPPQLLEAGRHEAVWYGRDDGGRQLGSGVYFYRLEAGGYFETKRMVLIK